MNRQSFWLLLIALTLFWTTYSGVVIVVSLWTHFHSPLWLDVGWGLTAFLVFITSVIWRRTGS